MPQYKYQAKKGVMWMAKFNYTDPKTNKIKTEYKLMRRIFLRIFLLKVARKNLFMRELLKMFTMNISHLTREKISRSPHLRPSTISLKSTFSQLSGIW